MDNFIVAKHKTYLMFRTGIEDKQVKIDDGTEVEKDPAQEIGKC